MKAADVTRAQGILSELHKIKSQRVALEAGVLLGGVRCCDNASTWIELRDDRLLSFVVAALDLREAEQRRLAAQIGLSL